MTFSSLHFFQLRFEREEEERKKGKKLPCHLKRGKEEEEEEEKWYGVDEKGISRGPKTTNIQFLSSPKG